MKSLVLLCAALFCASCAEEPKRLVGATTADGRFKLSLEATDDWVRPGFSLPVKVRVESLVGPLVEAWETELELVANNGDISPSSLYVEFDGVAEDEVANQADSVFEAWITFEAENRIEQLAQGEVHAMFLEQHAVIKLRITPEVEE